MTHRECLALLHQRLGAASSQRTPAAALAVVLELYRSVRVDDCELDGDGDMLLFQWGTYDWREGGEQFELDLTRQFMPTDDDAALTQLSLTMLFPAMPALTALGEGDRWCPTPGDAAEWEAFIRGSGAFLAVGDLSPTRVLLEQDEV